MTPTISRAWLAGLLPAATLFSVPAQAQVGFAWADRPTEVRYTPSGTYSYNQGGGPIRIRRLDAGHYRVRFVSLGDRGPGGGHVQVTAYGDGNENCKVVRWDYRADRSAFDVEVRCFSAAGRATDTRFTVLAGWPLGDRDLPGIESVPSAPLLPPPEDEDIQAITAVTVETLHTMINNLHDQVEAIRRELNKLADE